MNKLVKLLEGKRTDILSLFFTAGYPERDSTGLILKALQRGGVDLVEIGIPFSDPVADGPVIQKSSTVALDNGMSLDLLFDQLEEVRDQVSIPRLLMGYFNPVLQYGVDRFCRRCVETGVDGVIIPDLPFEVYSRDYKKYFEDRDLLMINLVTPASSEERIREISTNSRAFIYAVSTHATTGGKSSHINREYIDRIKAISSLPVLVGFGVSDRESYKSACNVASGAIIGSAFIEALKDSEDIDKTIFKFINSIRG